METHNVPVWVKQFCLQDRNTPGRDWQNEPFLYYHNDETWIFATDGIKLVGYKLPLEGHSFWTTETMTLMSIELPSIKEWVRDYLTKNLTTKINADRLRVHITGLLANNGCEQCNFTLQITCTACHGETEVECNRCHGQGSHPCATCNKPDACDPCEGLGVVECSTCVAGKINCPCLTRQNAEVVRLPEVGKTPAPIKLDKLRSALLYMQGDYFYQSGVISLFKNDNWLIAIAGVANVDDSDTLNIDLQDIISNEATIAI